MNDILTDHPWIERLASESFKIQVLEYEDARRKAVRKAREIARAHNVPAQPIIDRMTADCDILDPRRCTDCGVMLPRTHCMEDNICGTCLSEVPGFGE